MSVSTDTPVQVVSSFDHLVTQWMSLVNVSDGRAENSFHVQRRGSSISPSMVKVHWSRLTRGVGPAERTGKSVTRYCPGGTRELDAASRRLPLKPLETNPISGRVSRMTRGPNGRRAESRDQLVTTPKGVAPTGSANGDPVSSCSEPPSTTNALTALSAASTT